MTGQPEVQVTMPIAQARALAQKIHDEGYYVRALGLYPWKPGHAWISVAGGVKVHMPYEWNDAARAKAHKRAQRRPRSRKRDAERTS